MSDEFSSGATALTNILVVNDVARARDFYRDVVGATIYREYGGTSCVMQFLGAWLLLVTGGGPTEDKPGVSFVAPSDLTRVSHAMTIRVEDCGAAYQTLRSRGAVFLTPPLERPGEVRCFFRDPDGHLLEISESR
jgi:catechol 2,3-dioxygenase-like lactoylglutathione lyase family enzyme